MKKNQLIIFNDKYHPAMDLQAYRLCLLGLTNKEICTFFDIDIGDLIQWRETHPTFNDAMNNGRVIADSRVAEALYKRAIGFNRTVEKTCFVKEKEGGGYWESIKIQEEVLPDVKAQALWLGRRQIERWGARNTIEIKEVKELVSDEDIQLPLNPEDAERHYKDLIAKKVK